MSDEFDKALAQVNALVTQGKWDEALALKEQLLKVQPQNIALYQQYCQLAEKKGDIQKAVTGYLKWAQVCQSQGKLDDALKLYQNVLNMEQAGDRKGPFKGAGANPERIREFIGQYRTDISLQMGSIFLHKNQADEAIKYLKLALDSPIGAQDARVHTLLGIAYMQKNMDKEAIGEFQEVVRLAPTEAAFAYEKLGEIFIRGGKPPQSTIVWFRNAGDLYLRGL
ncbi:MAG: tetratricopeptide repeat protein, partial [Armatimonadetes bacterium]|nr:tetratricopeptide repeat protein [Armatimonadota bacterium]